MHQAHQEWQAYEALMQRLSPDHDTARALTVADCIVMYIDGVFDALESQLLHGGHHEQ
jgi:hypothetical protein